MTPLLEIRELKVHFSIGGGLFGNVDGYVQAVNGVNLVLQPNEVVALVGESGCGKTTLARAIMGLVAPTSGAIFLHGEDIASFRSERQRAYRRQVQMIFQDPFDSLNPRKTVFQTLAQPLRIHNVVPRKELRKETARLLDLVGLSPGEYYLDRYPHQFSGGQRQRICIARAIAVRPSVIVADEAVSALDVSIRAQILRLMKHLQHEMNLSYLFVTHDLGVVRSLCDRVIVMYLGEIVEEGTTEEIFENPRHPYTAALLRSCPIPDPEAARDRISIGLSGDVPSPINPPEGCRFHTRCSLMQNICRSVAPLATMVGSGHASRCHFANDIQIDLRTERRRDEVLSAAPSSGDGSHAGEPPAVA